MARRDGDRIGGRNPWDVDGKGSILDGFGRRAPSGVGNHVHLTPLALLDPAEVALGAPLTQFQKHQLYEKGSVTRTAERSPISYHNRPPPPAPRPYAVNDDAEFRTALISRRDEPHSLQQRDNDRREPSKYYSPVRAALPALPGSLSRPLQPTQEHGPLATLEKDILQAELRRLKRDMGPRDHPNGTLSFSPDRSLAGGARAHSPLHRSSPVPSFPSHPTPMDEASFQRHLDDYQRTQELARVPLYPVCHACYSDNYPLILQYQYSSSKTPAKLKEAVAQELQGRLGSLSLSGQLQPKSNRAGGRASPANHDHRDERHQDQFNAQSTQQRLHQLLSGMNLPKSSVSPTRGKEKKVAPKERHRWKT